MAYLLKRIFFIIFLCGTIMACEKEELTVESEVIVIEKEYITFELEIVNLVNKHRNDLGLSNLKLLNIISKEAEPHSIYMIEKGSLSHDNLDKRTINLMNITSALSVGENVAYGYQNPENVLKGWLNSESHRKNIEGKYYTHIGISAKKNNIGSYYITQIFIEKY
jgi:uncharacterized protein YkwD